MIELPDKFSAAVDANPYAPPAEKPVAPANAQDEPQTTHPFLAAVNATIATGAIGLAVLFVAEPLLDRLCSFLYGPGSIAEVNPISMWIIVVLLIASPAAGVVAGIRARNRRRISRPSTVESRSPVPPRSHTP